MDSTGLGWLSLRVPWELIKSPDAWLVHNQRLEVNRSGIGFGPGIFQMFLK